MEQQYGFELLRENRELRQELQQHKEALNNMSVSLRENVKFYFEIGSKEDLVNYFLTKAKGG